MLTRLNHITVGIKKLTLTKRLGDVFLQIQ